MAMILVLLALIRRPKPAETLSITFSITASELIFLTAQEHYIIRIKQEADQLHAGSALTVIHAL
jgi:hypothetical protein